MISNEKKSHNDEEIIIIIIIIGFMKTAKCFPEDLLPQPKALCARCQVEKNVEDVVYVSLSLSLVR